MIVTSLFALSLLGATIDVQVTKEEQPAPDVRVNLFEIVPGQGPQPLQDKQTSSRGRVRFNFEAKEETTYVLSASFDDNSFFSPLVRGSEIPEQPLEIEIFESIEWSDELKIGQILYSVQPRGKVLHIRQEILLDNPTGKIILAKNRPPLSINLPRGGHNLQFGYGFSQETTEFEKDRIVYRSQVKPGVSTLSLQYDIEKPGFAYTLEQDFTLPVEKIHVSTADMRLRFDGLDFSEMPSKFYNNRWVRVFEGTINDKEISFDVSGLPLIIPWVKLGPFGGLAILLGLLGLLLKVRPITLEEAQAKTSKPALLKELRELEAMKEKKLVDADDYLNRKYRLLCDLYPHYN